MCFECVRKRVKAISVAVRYSDCSERAQGPKEKLLLTPNVFSFWLRTSLDMGRVATILVPSLGWGASMCSSSWMAFSRPIEVSRHGGNAVPGASCVTLYKSPSLKKHHCARSFARGWFAFGGDACGWSRWSLGARLQRSTKETMTREPTDFRVRSKYRGADELSGRESFFETCRGMATQTEGIRGC